ncbi:hypothetical protein NET02_07115 [Thermomicrobiaceae bacterium CFH 74404]|uniref:Uncharacterized protein n=1 Tax=Thermalbibacter longus TaxID=2951981 RepID=A0AA42B9V9_9BACT|nr:hypothetical protein [Thermalbibacter longus]MCM8748907.1 hypothetical protein [Thermalbibacter longus]
MSASVVVEPHFVEQMQRAIERYRDLEPQSIPVDDPETPELAMPNRLAYALGWVLASAVVGSRFPTAAIDVLPVYHPEHGWDRFLVTRRVSCALHSDEPADSRGVLWLGEEDAPVFTVGQSVRLPLGTLCRTEPAEAIRRLLYAVPAPRLRQGDHSRCAHTRAEAYPTVHRVVTDLIVDYPGLIAARELFIDDQQVDGAYHPLYLATGAKLEGWTYEYFQLVYGDQIAFLRADGKLLTYEREPGTWRTVGELPLADPAALRARLCEVLRLGGASEATPEAQGEGEPEESGTASGTS